ncbi:MAG: type III-A CRISPR-associated RAMP protein Csm3 [Bdellovibrionota bacterium]|nr:type III-A CRISPR-associated RAMP protein Csm3 [Bdellovibrionota bacterium]
MTLQLKEIREFTGTIKLLTGLHIGAGDSVMRIGGADSLVVRDARTKMPYIPGSSIKGKLRSLFELESGLCKILDIKDWNDEASDDVKAIIKLFGISADSSSDSKMAEIGPTRLSFSDAFLKEDYIDNPNLVEVKAENNIDRKTATAKSPRFIERVVPGVEFKFTISVKFFDEENEEENLKNFMKFFAHGISLLELDALGASGSRGYGKVEFTFDNKDMQQYLNSERMHNKRIEEVING